MFRPDEHSRCAEEHFFCKFAHININKPIVRIGVKVKHIKSYREGLCARPIWVPYVILNGVFEKCAHLYRDLACFWIHRPPSSSAQHV